MRERKATDGKGKTLMRKRDYFQIKLTDDDGRVFWFCHDSAGTSPTGQVVSDPAEATWVGQHFIRGIPEIRRVTDALVSQGWRRDQMEFIPGGGMVEGGPVSIP